MFHYRYEIKIEIKIESPQRTLKGRNLEQDSNKFETLRIQKEMRKAQV